MASTLNKLSPAGVKSAATPGYLHDGGGLILQVTKTGAKSWLFQYNFSLPPVTEGDKPKRVRREKGLGPYPLVTLAQARDKAEALRRLRADGVIDPIAHERTERLEAAKVARQQVRYSDAIEPFMTQRKKDFKQQDRQAATWERSFAEAGKVLSAYYLHEITPDMVVESIMGMWHEKRQTAEDTIMRLNALFKWAKAKRLMPQDSPARLTGLLDQLLPKQVKQRTHRPALEWKDMPDFMTKLRACTRPAAAPMEFIVLTGTRVEEVLAMPWKEIDLAAKVWAIPAERMKAGKAHDVPLSPAAIALLKAQASYKDAKPDPETLVFTTPSGARHYASALSSELRTSLGYKQGEVTMHGMRSSLRTWLRAQNVEHDIAESAIAHDTRKSLTKTYERTRFFEERTPLMKDWAMFLDSANKVVKLPNARA
ncbi:phage integrase [Caballeronia pedi]|uniref:Phage integrase n=1 Tax=Caballeronia pedi TaxID=1777141 RepID=A0A158AZQ9_9BURK|nr:site-specific integrase [Caballeronia pedi]SAK63302.1 phage integrase [Caballeronia pedi]